MPSSAAQHCPATGSQTLLGSEGSSSHRFLERPAAGAWRCFSTLIPLPCACTSAHTMNKNLQVRYNVCVVVTKHRNTGLLTLCFRLRSTSTRGPTVRLPLLHHLQPLHQADHSSAVAATNCCILGTLTSNVCICQSLQSSRRSSPLWLWVSVDVLRSCSLYGYWSSCSCSSTRALDGNLGANHGWTNQ